MPERIARAERSAPLQLVDQALPTFTDEIYIAYRMDTLKTAAGKALIAAAKMALLKKYFVKLIELVMIRKQICLQAVTNSPAAIQN